MNPSRSCWSVLLNKAQEEVSRINLEIGELRQRLDSLKASRHRLVLLHEDYTRPPQPGTVSAGMMETLNRRQFADQLLTLVARVDRDILQVEQAMAGARARLLSAERERLKMQSLQDHDEKQARESRSQRERRQLDEVGTMRHNFGAGL